jgi:hypothetical protein
VENFLIEFAKRLVTAAGHELTYITSLTTPEIGADLARALGTAAAHSWFGHAADVALQPPRPACRLAEARVDLSIGFGRTCAQDIHRNGTGCSSALWQPASALAALQREASV